MPLKRSPKRSARVNKPKRSARVNKPKRSARSPRSQKSCKTKLSCKEKLASKIKINMAEYKNGLWKSPKQAIAVSYSQVLKKSPRCKSALRRKTK